MPRSETPSSEMLQVVALQERIKEWTNKLLTNGCSKETRSFTTVNLVGVEKALGLWSRFVAVFGSIF